MGHFTCKHVGVSGTTDVYTRQHEPSKRWEAAVGVALLGNTNLPAEALRTMSPFDDAFHDNIAVGHGDTEQEALDNLKKEIEGLSVVLWT